MKHLLRNFFSAYVLIELLSCSVIHADELYSYNVVNLVQYVNQSQGPWLSVITTQVDWQSFYTKTVAGNINPPSQSIIAPSIDFKNYQLILGGLGAKPTNGYNLIVENVTDATDGLYISVLDISPQYGCLAGQVVTYPYAALLVKKTEKPIKVNVSKAIKDCVN